jgi:hypothetical protein
MLWGPVAELAAVLLPQLVNCCHTQAGGRGKWRELRHWLLDNDPFWYSVYGWNG